MRQMAPEIAAALGIRPRWNERGERMFTVARAFDETANASVPMIRMRGQWLRKFGFTTGKRVAIAVEKNRLVITLDDAR